MSNAPKTRKPRLVEDATNRLRDIILEREPGAQIGSLNEVAQLLDVGIVTVQQSARILEHEGLLTVKRGPGGGYYGARPDEAALERAFAVYMRLHGFDYRDALSMMVLFDCEIFPAAARCQDDQLRAPLQALRDRVEDCHTVDDRIRFERELRELLFRIVQLPLIELLARVTTQLHQQKGPPGQPLFPDEAGAEVWRGCRRRMLQAIIDRDPELAQFEAERYRQQVLQRIGQHH